MGNKKKQTTQKNNADEPDVFYRFSNRTNNRWRFFAKPEDEIRNSRTINFGFIWTLFKFIIGFHHCVVGEQKKIV